MVNVSCIKQWLRFSNKNVYIELLFTTYKNGYRLCLTLKINNRQPYKKIELTVRSKMVKSATTNTLDAALIFPSSPADIRISSGLRLGNHIVTYSVTRLCYHLYTVVLEYVFVFDLITVARLRCLCLIVRPSQVIFCLTFFTTSIRFHQIL